MNSTPRTLEQVRADIAEAKAKGDAGADISLARLGAKYGNFTPEAREYARRYAAGEPV